MDDQTRILDVAISALQQEMWVRTGQPPRSMHQLAEWGHTFFQKNQCEAVDILERVPGLIESMGDVTGDFWDELWIRIQMRKMRGN